MIIRSSVHLNDVLFQKIKKQNQVSFYGNFHGKSPFNNWRRCFNELIMMSEAEVVMKWKMIDTQLARQ